MKTLLSLSPGCTRESDQIDTAGRQPILYSAMRTRLPRAFAVGIAVIGWLTVGYGADSRVIVSATAAPEYTLHKYGDSQTKRESYVVMQGHYFEGEIADKSVDRIPFRRITEIFAPELAMRQYWPVKNIKDADLLIVVHWGTTAPPVSALEMAAETSMELPYTLGNAVKGTEEKPSLLSGYYRALRFVALERETDSMSNQAAHQRISQLLGYTRTLNDPKANSAATDTLTNDVGQARYFIILKAYDLHASTPAARSRAVWTLHLNMSSPGNNFGTALDYMAKMAVNYFGRSSDGVESIKPSHDGKVEIGPTKVIEMPVSTTPPEQGR